VDKPLLSQRPATRRRRVLPISPRLPPSWYKDPAYRARVVREPRAVLAEMGLELADDVQITVRDSISEVRWLVLPERPAGTEHLTEEELVPLVSRDAVVGVANVCPSRTRHGDGEPADVRHSNHGWEGNGSEG
jgi:Nitrile hydratase, alpha chain